MDNQSAINDKAWEELETMEIEIRRLQALEFAGAKTALIWLSPFLVVVVIMLAGIAGVEIGDPFVLFALQFPLLIVGYIGARPMLKAKKQRHTSARQAAAVVNSMRKRNV
ncbi:hypothetical protein [uncultured Roseobacter sp.]|uniref:hypothetical protein n=1 Tax=uncultured Roseobacter sp. TaxID=114847 RepID=UPI00261A78A0|nr:hypothetical protein [uncultured Roseobacter sp.]